MTITEKTRSVKWLFHKKDQVGDFYLSIKTMMNKLNNAHASILSTKMYESMFEVYSSLGQNPILDVLEKESSHIWYPTAVIEGVDKSYKEDYISTNNVAFDYIQEDGIAVIRIDSFNHLYTEPDIIEIKKFLSEYDLSTLIIDISNNSGGSRDYWQKHLIPLLIEEPIEVKTYCAFRGEYFEEFASWSLGRGYDVKKIERNSFDSNFVNYPAELLSDFEYINEVPILIEPAEQQYFSGEIYLYISNRVYSASDTLASVSRNSSQITVVGEATSGGGLGIDPVVCALPNSGIVVRFPCAMGLAQDGTMNEEYGTLPELELTSLQDLIDYIKECE